MSIGKREVGDLAQNYICMDDRSMDIHHVPTYVNHWCICTNKAQCALHIFVCWRGPTYMNPRYNYSLVQTTIYLRSCICLLVRTNPYVPLLIYTCFIL